MITLSCCLLSTSNSCFSLKKTQKYLKQERRNVGCGKWYEGKEMRERERERNCSCSRPGGLRDDSLLCQLKHAVPQKVNLKNSLGIAGRK